jgi:hypothetical protein
MADQEGEASQEIYNVETGRHQDKKTPEEGLFPVTKLWYG